MLKVALVGCGGISQSHFNGWEQIPEAKMIAVCDIRPKQLTAPMEKFGCPGYTDIDEMLRKEKPDILDICVPTYLHIEFALKALRKGIHVLCEKPVSLNKRDVKRVYDAAKKNGCRFMVAQVVRFWREYMFVEDAIKTGRYGKLLSGTMTRLGQVPHREFEDWMAKKELSGLVPFDLHIHDLDWLIYMFGKPAKVVCDRIRGAEQDFIHAVYHYPDFIIDTQSAWFNTYRFSSAFRFQFEKALLEMEHGHLTIMTQGRITTLDEEAKGDNGLDLPQTGAYYNEIRYFTDCVLAGKDCEKVQPEQLETVLDIIKNKIDKA